MAPWRPCSNREDGDLGTTQALSKLGNAIKLGLDAAKRAGSRRRSELSQAFLEGSWQLQVEYHPG